MKLLDTYGLMNSRSSSWGEYLELSENILERYKEFSDNANYKFHQAMRAEQLAKKFEYEEEHEKSL